MRFGPDRLLGAALIALEEATQECRYQRVRRTFALRFALTYVWVTGAGERQPIENFWSALDVAEQMWRFSRADSALNEIYRGLDLTRDHELGMRVWERLDAKFRALPTGKKVDPAG